MYIEHSATLSACGHYRYRLTRRWAEGGSVCLFIMLNPSTADALQDDPTIRRCVGFARREGCAALKVVNLFAWRATHPRDLVTAPDPIGPENDAAINAASATAGLVVAAWGGPIPKDQLARAGAVVRMLHRPVLCLGRTQEGHPKHPLRLPRNTALAPFFDPRVLDFIAAFNGAVGTAAAARTIAKLAGTPAGEWGAKFEALARKL